jgi:hypothetical protein
MLYAFILLGDGYGVLSDLVLVVLKIAETGG